MPLVDSSVSVLLGILVDGFLNVVSAILAFIPKLVYFLCTCIMTIIDALQLIFRKLVGLDVYYINGNQVEKQGDIIFEIIRGTFFEGRYPALYTAFWSIIILASILLFVTTIAGILRNEYTPDKDKLNSKTGVIKNTFKAIFSLVLIPLTCFFALYLGNSVMKVIDQVTQPAVSSPLNNVNGIKNWDGTETQIAFSLFGVNVPTSYTPISGIIFKATCYDANRVREDDTFFTRVISIDDSTEGLTTNFGVFNVAERTLAAELIDDAFMINACMANPARLNNSVSYDNDIFNFYPRSGTMYSFNRYDVGLVSYYYNLWKMNWPVLLVAIIIVAKMYLQITLGLMRRLFEMTGLLVSVPIIISFMPIDNGGAFGRWRAYFITATMSAYIGVLAMNMFNILYPLINTITFFPKDMHVVNYLITSIFIIAGLQTVQSLSKMFADIFKIDKIDYDVMGKGKESLDGIQDATRTATAMTTGVTRMAMGGAALVGGAAVGLVGGGINRFRNRGDRQEIRDAGRQMRGRNVADRYQNSYVQGSGISEQRFRDSEARAHFSSNGGLVRSYGTFENWRDNGVAGTASYQNFIGNDRNFTSAAANARRDDFVQGAVDPTTGRRTGGDQERFRTEVANDLRNGTNTSGLQDFRATENTRLTGVRDNAQQRIQDRNDGFFGGMGRLGARTAAGGGGFIRAGARGVFEPIRNVFYPNPRR